MILVAIQFMEEVERRREIMAKPIHDAIASNQAQKQTEQEKKDLFPFTLALSACIRTWFSPHLRLSSQMQCSHLAEFSNSPLRASILFPSFRFL